MSVRDDRETAFWSHWRRGLKDDPRPSLPPFLDALEDIDAKHVADGPGHIRTVSDAPTDAEITAWIRAHDREFEAMVRKWNRVRGNGRVTPPAEQPKPPRRRTTRKDGE